MNSKITSIVLLLVFIAPVMITYTLLHYQKYVAKQVAKRRMEKGFDKEELLLLKFSKKDAETVLKWEHSKEFEYNQKMYDVFQKKLIGDTIYFWCWLDQKETDINEQLSELAVTDIEKKATDKKYEKQLLYFKERTKAANITTRKVSVIKKEQKHFFSYQCSYDNILLSPPVPPPQSV